jgi:hypothetical protein
MSRLETKGGQQRLDYIVRSSSLVSSRILTIDSSQEYPFMSPREAALFRGCDRVCVHHAVKFAEKENRKDSITLLHHSKGLNIFELCYSQEQISGLKEVRRCYLARNNPK